MHEFIVWLVFTGELEIKRMGQDNKEADYNLDTNEAESETDKQAALVNQQNSFHGNFL